jgi:hypothetical protein
LAARLEAEDPAAAAALPAGARGISTGSDPNLLRFSRQLLPEPEPVLARGGEISLVTTACLAVGRAESLSAHRNWCVLNHTY